MPGYELDRGTTPLEGLLGLAATVAGVNVQNKTKQKTDEQNAARQAMLDKQAAALQAATIGKYTSEKAAADANTVNTETKTTGEVADQAQKNIIKTQDTGLRYPPGFDKYTPDQKRAYLQVRLNAAEKAQNAPLVAATQKQMADISASAVKLQGQLPEDQAKTANLKGLYSQQLKLLDKKDAAVMEGLRMKLQSGLQRAGMSEGAAMQRAQFMAMNQMERQVNSQQFTAGVAQYVQGMESYRASGGTTPLPGVPTVQGGGQTTVPITIYMPGADGKPKPVVINRPPPALPDIHTVVQTGKSRHMSDDVIRAKLKAGGYPDAAIDKVLPQKGSGWGSL